MLNRMLAFASVLLLIWAPVQLQTDERPSSTLWDNETAERLNSAEHESARTVISMGRDPAQIYGGQAAAGLATPLEGTAMPLEGAPPETAAPNLDDASAWPTTR